jgi:beta-N-acetylhexosaminidase
MVANATYPTLDPERPASQSRRVISKLLRDELGFDGVIITDDLGAGAITGAGIDEASAAVGAVKAGADLALVALTDGAAAVDALLQALRSGELDRDALDASCARITALRERLAGAG